MRLRLFTISAISLLLSACPSGPGKDGGQPRVGTADLKVSVYPGRTAVVHVVRPLGMTGAISLTLRGLPAGVTASTVTLAANTNEGTLTLSTLPSIKPADVSLAQVVTDDDAGTGASRGGGEVIISVEIPDAGSTDETLHLQGVPFPSHPLASVGNDADVVVLPDDGFVYGDLVTGDLTSLVPSAATVENSGSLVFHRFLADGTWDTGYGDHGYLIADVATASGAGEHYENQASFAIGSQQGLLVAIPKKLHYSVATDGGLTDDGPYQSARVIRFDSHGQRDEGFGTGGQITLAAGDEAWHVISYADGRVLLGVRTRDIYGNSVGAELRRYMPNGSLDAAFGSGGVAPVGTDNSRDMDVVRASDGTIAAASAESMHGAVVARYTDKGQPLMTFGNNGRTTVSVEWAFGSNQRQLFLAVGPSGQVALALRLQQDSSYLAVFTKEGALDGSFADGGLLLEGPSTDGTDHHPGSVGFDSKGRVLQGVQRQQRNNGISRDSFIRRYSASGTLELELHTGPGFWSSFTVEADDRLLTAGGSGFSTSAGTILTPSVSRFWP